ncbi:hypothetical protein ZWY2020_018816 [Hordeum vulgare]|nr:hypothetical protein ZWY2020_018816 [Hordeum vulgare]
MSQKRQPEEGERPRWGGCGGGVPAESGGTSSPGEPKRQQVPALREASAPFPSPSAPSIGIPTSVSLIGLDWLRSRRVITEVMRKSSIEKLFSSIEPLIRRVVKEEIELALANHAAMMTRSPTYTVPSTSKNLQLQFTTKLSLPIFTGSKVEGEVEIVVLEGDFEGEGNDWTAQEFNNNIVKERQDNSSWTRSRKFRLGARSEDGCFNGVRVREAKTESFVVKDHRGELYKKHHHQFLKMMFGDWRRSARKELFKRLNKEKIITVKDFLTLLHLDAPRLRKILGTGMSTKMWEVTVEHAKTTCVLSEKVHIYYLKSPSKTAVVFNAVGEVRGLISEKFVSADDLTEIEKAEAHAAVKQAYEDWKNVSTCDSDTLVENPSQLFNMRSPSLHESGFYQLPTQELQKAVKIDFSQASPLGGHGQPRESHALDRFSNSLVFEESTSHASFNEEDYYCRPGPDPPVSFDSQDLGAALKGFIAISKPKPYRGWRALSYVIGWIFYTKRMAAQKRKKPGNDDFHLPAVD